MARETKKHVFFVDDEPGIRKVVARTLGRLGVEVTCFSRAVDCVEQLNVQACDLLITDLKMPGMDGIGLLSEAKRMAPWLSVLLVTGYGDVPVAVKAIQLGAADFIEKPLHKKSFLRKVKFILDQNNPVDPYTGKGLTRMELKVLKLIVAGKSNKEVARLLGRSVRTIEDHRNHIMRKLGVQNAVELVQRAIHMGLIELPPSQ
ncbi:MAG: response regulator transcription factor [Sedimentisphaerales bacterium]|nr:response regulator transcription factor [Sedimentisphaerales bacterium]